MVIITVVLNSWKVPKQSWQSERTGSGKEKAYDRCDPCRIRIELNDESVRGAGAKVCECNSYFSQRSYSEVLHQPDRSRPVTSNSSCGSWSNWLNMASSGDPSLKVVESMEELRLIQSNRRSSSSMLPSPSFYISREISRKGGWIKPEMFLKGGGKFFMWTAKYCRNQAPPTMRTSPNSTWFGVMLNLTS